MRQDMVAVKAKDGLGNVTHCASHRAIKAAAGEVVTKWEDGSPITRAEFDAVLAPTEHFEIVQNSEIAGPAQKTADKQEE